MEQEKTLYTYEDVKKVPRIVKAVIIDIYKTTGIEIYGDTVNKPDQEYLSLTFESTTNDIRGKDYLAEYTGDELTDRSKLGKYLLKYKELKIGQQIYIELNDKGFYHIQL